MDGSRSPVSFADRAGATAAASAQVRQFCLHRGLSTLAGIAEINGTCKRADRCKHHTSNQIMAVPLADRLAVSQREKLASHTWLENDDASRHTDSVATSRTDMETSHRADQPTPLLSPSSFRRLTVLV